MVRPHPSPLPLERENGHQSVGETDIVGFFPSQAKRFLLPGGEGQGERKPTFFSRNPFVGRRPFAVFCLFAFAATLLRATTTNDLSDAQIQGRQLAQKILKILEQQPAENFTNTGHLIIRHKGSPSDAFRFQFRAVVTATNWQAIYETTSESYCVKCLIVHDIGGNRFFEERNDENIKSEPTFPFAGSDFWLADLGLEFFHWPEQKVLKKEVKRSRGCTVLESTNPNPTTNGYSRVVSWIDNESGGIVQAEAYDFKNKLLKEFAPKTFKKVNGQWELKEMEIRNNQTGSRTRLELDGFPPTNSSETTTAPPKK